MLRAAMLFTDRHKRGLKKFEKQFPFWAIEAYKANERAFDRAEAEKTSKIGKDKEGDEALSMDQGGDTDTFANIEKQFGIEPKKPPQLKGHESK